MKAKIIISLIAASLSLTACHNHADEHGHNHDHESHHAVESHDHHDHEGHNHDIHHGNEAEKEHKDEHGEIELHDHAAERFGVTLDTVSPGDFHSVVRAAGRVQQASSDDAVAVAPVAGIVHFSAGINPGATLAKGGVIATVESQAVSGGDANAAAKAAYESASVDLARIEDLYTERLATLSELIAARAAFETAQASYSPQASSGKVVSPVSGTITTMLVKEGQYVSAGDPVVALGKGNGSVLEVSLPNRYYSKASQYIDLIVDFNGEAPFVISERGGRRLSSSVAASSMSSGGYVPLYFSAAVAYPVGTPFTAYLIGDRRSQVLTVPAAALSEQQGQYFVYRQSKPEHYMKVPVTIGESDGVRVEIKSGIATGDIIVGSGVQAVRLAETSAVAPQGHTHNH